MNTNKTIKEIKENAKLILKIDIKCFLILKYKKK